jgi:hypothetical protein
MMTWTRGVQQIVFMGDLNETLTSYDRHPRPAPVGPRAAAAATPSPIQCLIDEGFTHFIDSTTQCSRGRIDYIWTRGTSAASHLDIHIDAKLRDISHHRLVWMDLHLQRVPSPPCDRPLYHMKLPNLRDLSPEQQEVFVDHLEKCTIRQEHHLRTLDDTLSTSSLSSLAIELTTLTHDSASTKLPITGSTPYSSKSVLRLERQRRDLTRLLHIASTLLQHGHSLIRSPEWTRLHQHCMHLHGLRWAIDAYYDDDAAGWINETRQHINRTCRTIAKEKHRLKKARASSFDVNFAAMIHRMLQSDAPPSQLHAVIDSNGELTCNTEELEDVMVNHFESVFAIPPPDPTPLLPPPPPMLFDKPSILPEWYEGLMDEVTEDELLVLVTDVPLVSAPGLDEVSTGVWKLALQGSAAMRTHVSSCHSSKTLRRIVR